MQVHQARQLQEQVQEQLVLAWLRLAGLFPGN